jgi:hypothetical protein
MSAGIGWLIGAVGLAAFGVFLRFAVQALIDKQHRALAAWFFWSFMPLLIVSLVLVKTGDPVISELTRNLLLGGIGALTGASLCIWAGYLILDTRATAQPVPQATTQPVPEKGPTVAQGPTINTWNQSGGTNTINIGPQRLAFDQTIGEELIRRLPAGKPVHIRSVGSNNDQQVANQYQAFLQERGFNVNRSIIGMMAPPPDHKISITDTLPEVIILIAPSAN